MSKNPSLKTISKLIKSPFRYFGRPSGRLTKTDKKVLAITAVIFSVSCYFLIMGQMGILYRFTKWTKESPSLQSLSDNKLFETWTKIEMSDGGDLSDQFSAEDWAKGGWVSNLFFGGVAVLMLLITSIVLRKFAIPLRKQGW
jgi:hypothetical protein